MLSSIVIGTASTAPPYSLAATLGLIVARNGNILCGVKAPVIVLIAFIPMYMLAIAYKELNRAEPDCGTAFAWSSRAFGPVAGWIGGWAIIAADVILMANLAQIAGSYSFTFVGNLGWHSAAHLANSTAWTMGAGVLWIVVMAYVNYRGIDVSARLQYVLLSVELVVLVGVAFIALIRIYTSHGGPHSLQPSLSWLWPGGLDFGTSIAPAVLITIFIFWGFETAVTCNEESDDPSRTPGRAAVMSTVLLVLTYILVTVASIAFAGVGREEGGLSNPDSANDVFAAIGPPLFGHSFLGQIGLLLLSASILTSASACTQTSILPAARTSLSMASCKALPESFAKMHLKYQTPSVSTIVMGTVSVLFYILFTMISPNLLNALVGSIGLVIALYYAMTGYACVHYYRKTLTTSVRNFFMRGVFPLIGGATLTVVFVFALTQYAQADWLVDNDGHNVTIFGFGAVAVVGVASILIGVILMCIWWAMSPDFFRGRTLERRHAGTTPVPSSESAAIATPMVQPISATDLSSELMAAEPVLEPPLR
ncbi:APC family permease [Mycobacterium stomatepiae]|uniref:Putative amino acid permease n=1 Tax=Mycobacterium stomatepiae TaxID=470076 RepID=A0A7I7Q8W7_9MYCO|nr:APC family permease [Mycobacterium stomatepiae]MCV7164573.1 APC family permease [Mycobacterium stomatepiae]BBY22770.1 putative amino acid permease [Mycobacterium stomatepiae]